MVDRALLAHPAELGSGLNLNLQWRQLVVSEVSVDANLCQVERSQLYQALAISICWNYALRECADACVDQTRFDPRRSAESEQTLLDALPGVLAALKDRPEVSVELGTTSFKVSRSRLEKAGKSRVGYQCESGALSIDESLSVFPGITFDELPLSIPSQPPERIYYRITQMISR